MKLKSLFPCLLLAVAVGNPTRAAESPTNIPVRLDPESKPEDGK